MQMFEILIIKTLPINTLPSRAIHPYNIPCLRHEVWDYSVELVALVMQRLSVGSDASFPGAETPEVFSRHRAVIIELEYHSPDVFQFASFFSFGFDVHEHPIEGCFTFCDLIHWDIRVRVF